MSIKNTRHGLSRPLLFALVAAVTLAAARSDAGEPSTPAAAPASGKEVLVIKESKDAQTFNAKSQDVTVNGNHNKVTITGECHALTISGDGNHVTVAAVSSISLTGTGNEVAWAKAVSGEKPQVTDLGKGNAVTRSSGKSD